MSFLDRVDAGRRLAAALAARAGDPALLVLGLPRGGVVVAAEVASALGAPLDVFVVRKLGVPGQPELAMGAIASGGVRLLNENVIKAVGIPPEAIERVAAREAVEVDRRERAYRGDRPAPDPAGRCVILVDDGIATGSTMHAAVKAIRSRSPARLTVAVPLAPAEARGEFEAEADDYVCLVTPEPFVAVGVWYEDFSQTSDEEVRRLLSRAEPAAVTPSWRRSDPGDSPRR